jgi:ABC-type glycerol-3-phosphate transport system substrate-binding protein
LGADGAKVTINNELGIRTLEWLQTLVKAQGGWDAVTGALEPSKGVVGTFTNGRLGYLYETSDQPARDDFKNAQGLQYGVTSYPLPKNGKRVALGGCHAFCITTQSKVPEGAWRFLEHLATDASSLRFAQRYRGIPVRVSTARSAAFQQNDPLLKQAVDEMNYVRWLIPAPGGTEMAGLYKTMPENVMAGKLSIRDALADTERQMQLVLDTWKR